jgi:Transglycosylase SLT domain
MIGRALFLAFGLWLAGMAAVTGALATEIRVPLTIPYLTLAEALKAQVYTAPGHRAELWRESECQYLYAENPRFSRDGDLLRMESDAYLNVGTLVGSNCINAIAWQGIAEAVAVPYVTPDWKLKFRVRDLNVYNFQHQKTALAGRGFDLVKGYFVPSLEQFSFDLKTPLTQLTQLAELATPDNDRPRLRQGLATMSTVPPATMSADGLRVMLRMNVPTAPAAGVAPRSQPLTQADIDAWQNALDAWDAFVVFAVKQLGASIADKQSREELLDLLLDSRHRLVAVLAQPRPSDGPDPVRLLFIDTWSSFDRIVQRAAERGSLGNRTLEFLSFISAGDALIAFDQAAPALGMRITEQDLRGLAHIVAPRLHADPLAFSFDEDPELQKLFNIHPPAELPDALFNGPDDTPESAPRPPPEPSGGHSSAERRPLDFLALLVHWISPIASAAATPVVVIDREILEVARPLRRKVPEPANVREYTADVGQLLDLSAARELDDDYLEAQYGPTMRRLVRSAAWQESCWRQFVRKGKRVTFLESSSHDLGLMQVNKYVWRGFYSIARLQWDIAYNAGAGAQILLRRLRDCARSAAGQGDAASSDDLVRSAYSAYNGGPASCKRWNSAGVPSEKALIDVSFWLKYQALEQGNSFDILKCAAQWDHAPGH